MPKYIQTRSGKFIIIDNEDAHWFDECSYRIYTPVKAHTSYVVLRLKDDERSYVGLLHNLIFGDSPVDHANGNGLDCRKSNLKKVTLSENQQNRRRTSNLVKGVYWRKDRQCWTSRITINNKVIVLGCFFTHEQAVIARIKAEDQYFTNAGQGTEYPEVMTAVF